MEYVLYRVAQKECNNFDTVYAIYFAGVLFSRISRVGAFREFNNTRK